MSSSWLKSLYISPRGRKVCSTQIRLYWELFSHAKVTALIILMCPPLSVVRYSCIQLSELRQRRVSYIAKSTRGLEPCCDVLTAVRQKREWWPVPTASLHVYSERVVVCPHCLATRVQRESGGLSPLPRYTCTAREWWSVPTASLHVYSERVVVCPHCLATRVQRDDRITDV